MIRFVFRLLGLFALAAAFVALLYDGTQTIAANQLSITPLARIWTNLHAPSLQALEAGVQHHAPVWAREPLLTSLLTAPAALVLAIVGAVLLLLGRRKKPPIGYAR